MDGNVITSRFIYDIPQFGDAIVTQLKGVDMSKIGFLGLGAMGSRMAANLLKAGHTVTVWNRSPAAAEALVASGARKASSPKEEAEGADFVFATVRDDDASQKGMA